MDTLNVMLDEGAKLPERAHTADAGFDLFIPTNWKKTITIFGRESLIVDTGVHVEIPEGYVGILKSKSGLNVKNNLTGTGVIDSGYTGSIVAKLYNHGREKHIFQPGDKIIQLLIIKCETPELIITDHFEKTERNDKGFGSSGK